MSIFMLKNTIIFSVSLKMFDIKNKIIIINNSIRSQNQMFVKKMYKIINFIKTRLKEFKFVLQIDKINYHPPDT